VLWRNKCARFKNNWARTEIRPRIAELEDQSANRLPPDALEQGRRNLSATAYAGFGHGKSVRTWLDLMVESVGELDSQAIDIVRRRQVAPTRIIRSRQKKATIVETRRALNSIKRPQSDFCFVVPRGRQDSPANR